ncbi:MAG: FAD-linked oxidase C-terminal domain-containing protein [Pyrinomonadaceae bacterium]
MNKSIKRVFDPNGILNPGKMFVGILIFDSIKSNIVEVIDSFEANPLE